MRSRDVDIAVNRDVFWAVSRAVYDGAVYDAVSWDVDRAAWRALGGAMHRAVEGAVPGAVWNDPEPPALQDFLLEALA
jgi:hypothetical protein